MHAAFLGDVVEELQKGPFELQIAWAEDVGGEPGERPAKTSRVESFPQSPGDLGERLFSGLRHLSQTFSRVAAIGSDHPELRAATVADAFTRLTGADVVLGPTTDGGYYLIGVRREILDQALFTGIPWSTEAVLETTLQRCEELGLRVELLPEGRDVDVPEDLDGLAERLASGGAHCQRTIATLRDLGRLPAAEEESCVS